MTVSATCVLTHEAAWQSHVWTVHFGVRFLKKSSKEVVTALRMREDKVTIASGQAVIDDHLVPFAEVPEAESENSSVIVHKRLVGRSDRVDQFRIPQHQAKAGHESAVTKLTLHHRLSVWSLRHEFRVLRNLLSTNGGLLCVPLTAKAVSSSSENRKCFQSSTPLAISVATERGAYGGSQPDDLVGETALSEYRLWLCREVGIFKQLLVSQTRCAQVVVSAVSSR